LSAVASPRGPKRRRGGEDLGLIYLQLALYLEPSHAMALLSLADLYETLKKSDLAIKAYERVPSTSPLYRNAEIQLAVDLDALDRSDEAKKRLDHVVAEHPKDTEALLGDRKSSMNRPVPRAALWALRIYVTGYWLYVIAAAI